MGNRDDDGSGGRSDVYADLANPSKSLGKITTMRSVARQKVVILTSIEEQANSKRSRSILEASNKFSLIIRSKTESLRRDYK